MDPELPLESTTSEPLPPTKLNLEDQSPCVAQIAYQLPDSHTWIRRPQSLRGHGRYGFEVTARIIHSDVPRRAFGINIRSRLTSLKKIDVFTYLPSNYLVLTAANIDPDANDSEVLKPSNSHGIPHATPVTRAKPMVEIALHFL
jgi:hypothetical protein